MQAAYVAELTRRNRVAKHIAGVTRSMARFIDFAGNVTAADVDANTITRFLQHLARHEHVAPRTQNHYRTELAAWWNFAVKQGFVERNPVLQTSPATIDQDLIVFPEPEEMIAFVDASDPWDAALWTLAVLTGLRRSSIIKLSPERFGSDAIRVLTKRRIEWFMRYDSGCPLWSPDLAALGLRIWREQEPTEHIIESHFDATRRRVRKHFIFNSLRHAFGSYCVLMGESMTDVAAWMHHTTQTTTEKYYVHLQPRGRARIEQNRERMFTMRSHCLEKAMA